MHFKEIMFPVAWREEQREREIKMPHTSHFLSSLYLGQCYSYSKYQISKKRYRDGEKFEKFKIDYEDSNNGAYSKVYIRE